MPYEHQQQANQAAKALVDMLGLLTDDIPDQEQILALTTEASMLFATASAALAGEAKRSYKAKFAAKVLARATSLALDQLLPDSES